MLMSLPLVHFLNQDSKPSWLRALGYERMGEGTDWEPWWWWTGYPGLRGLYPGDELTFSLGILGFFALGLASAFVLLGHPRSIWLSWAAALFLTAGTWVECVLQDDFMDFIGHFPAVLWVVPSWLLLWSCQPPNSRSLRIGWTLLAIPIFLNPEVVCALLNRDLSESGALSFWATVASGLGLVIVLWQTSRRIPPAWLRRFFASVGVAGSTLALVAVLPGEMQLFSLLGLDVVDVAFGVSVVLPWVWIAGIRSASGSAAREALA